MPEFEEILDILTAVFVIIIISAIITLVWMSTYVRDQSVIATAVVVFQQDTTATNSVTNSSREANNPMDSSTQTLECDTSVTSVPETSETRLSDPSTKGDEGKVCEDSLQLNEQSQGENSESVENSIETQPENENSVAESDKLNNFTPVEKEESDGASVLRQRKCNLCDSDKEIANKRHPSESINSNNENQSSSEEYIRIKLKFLDDTHRLVRGHLTDEVGSFKRANFDPELSSNRVVRLIFNGQLLNRDTSTLGQYGLFDNCVVHCHISQPQSTNSSDRNERALNQESDNFDISDYLNPLLILILVILWYLRYEYSHIFNTSATIVLVCLTALLLISQYALVHSFNASFGLDGGNGNNSSSSSNSSRTNTNILTTNIGSSVEQLSHQSSVATSSSQITPSSTPSEEQPLGNQPLENSHTDTHSCTEKLKKSEPIQDLSSDIAGECNYSLSNEVHDSSGILLSS